MKTKSGIDAALGLPTSDEWKNLIGEEPELDHEDDEDEGEMDLGDITVDDIQIARDNMAQLREYRNQLKDIPDVTKRKSHLDRLAKIAEDRFEDMFDRAFNCEDRFAAEMLNAANAMLKIALDAHAKVIDSDIKLIDMQLKKDKMEYEINSKSKGGVVGDPAAIEGSVVQMTRNQRIASRNANK